METLIENIVVKNRYLPEEEIREEIAIVLRGVDGSISDPQSH
jgi:hypothetical protein